MFKNNKTSLAIIAALSGFTLVGCGGGSSMDTTPTPIPTTPTAPPISSTPTWTAGVFEQSNDLKNFCETPRTGNDPFNNNAPYPDQVGSALYEKLWLRSWSDETYLWYDEIADNDPESFATVADYFAQLKTEQLTDSGAKKDNFHFSEPTEDYFQEAQSGVTSGYGINWAFIGDSADRILRVAYLEDGSPASQIGFQRGDTVLSVDGVSITTNTESGIDTLNEGLFSPTNGDSHTIVVQSNDGAEKTFNVTAGNIEQTPVQNVKTITTANGSNVGYMQFNSHISIAQEGLIDAVNKFKADRVDELVIDFRYNGGGLLALSAQLAYMVAGSANVQNRFYYQTQQNDKQPVDSPFPFIDEEIDYSTFFINGLKGIDAEVILIGDTTCGKPYGFTPTHNCATTYYTIQFSGVNNQGFGEYAAGFSPTPTPQFNADVQGCKIEDDFDHQLGDSNEAVLATALFHVENGSCPIRTATAAKAEPVSFSNTQESLAPLNVSTQFTQRNMDLTWPTLSEEK